MELRPDRMKLRLVRRCELERVGVDVAENLFIVGLASGFGCGRTSTVGRLVRIISFPFILFTEVVELF